MALDKLSFTKNWTNSNDFSTVETDEAAVRSDMQLLHDETKSYINEKVVPAVDAVRKELDEAVEVQNQTKHTHSNKALLDTYTQTEENLADAVAKKHSHPNKEVLDGIAAVTQELGAAADKVPSEAAVSDAIAKSGNLPAGGVAGQALVKKSDESYDTQWDTLTAARVGAYSKGEVDALLSENPNPNLLDNWYFGNPVNQRGDSAYIGGGKYTIDRWWAQYDTGVELISGGIEISGKWDVQQYMDTLPEGTYTFSVLYDQKVGSDVIRAIIGRKSGNDLAYVETMETSGLISCTAKSDEITAVKIGFIGSSDNSARLIAVKLEPGDKQTLAHQDENGNWVPNEIPDYGEQLARCQRYYQLYSAAEQRPAKAVDCRPTMRVDPSQGTITIDGTTYYYNTADM